MDVKKLAKSMLVAHSEHGAKRVAIYEHANNILRTAKKTIFALHRGDRDGAEQLVIQNISRIEEVRKLIDNDTFLFADRGAFAAAVEEFYESVFFFAFIANKDMDEVFTQFADIVFYEIYLSAMCDYTGELVRYAVRNAQVDTITDIDAIRAQVDDIVGVLLEFDNTGKLRVKLEDVKRNLKKLEAIVYDLRIRQ